MYCLIIYHIGLVCWWFFVKVNNDLAIYVKAHKCAGGPKKTAKKKKDANL